MSPPSVTLEGPPQGPPVDADALLVRAHALAGRTLGELAEAAGEEVPDDLRRHKGWTGQLLERWLGTTAGNKQLPDFVELGIELKTLPVDRTGMPLETTYVSMVPLVDVEDLTWRTSSIYKKLAAVLWVPIHAEREIEIAWRMVGRAVLWRPCAEEERQLRADWMSHMLAIRHGAVEEIRGGDGEVLQIRPKAADSSVRTASVDADGGSIMTLPRGFYLRREFTHALLTRGLTHR